MYMHIGVTGTRSGMNDVQKENFVKELLKITDIDENVYEFHHGDCIGVDVEAATIADELLIWINCHPPINEKHRAFHDSDYIFEAKDYFARNRDIVNESDIVFVIPYQNEPTKEGGTWYTYRYAKSKNKPIILLYPDGRIIKENVPNDLFERS